MSEKNIHCLKKKPTPDSIYSLCNQLSALGLFAYKSEKGEQNHLFHKTIMRFKLGEVIWKAICNP